MASDDTPKKPKKSPRERFAKKMRSFRKFMWNKEERTCMGRRGLDWLKIIAFYLSFYAGLTCLWVICMACFLKTLDPNVPTQQHKYSMLKDNPGMSFWTTSASDSALVFWSSTNDSLYSQYTTGLNSVLNSTYPDRYPEFLEQNCSPGKPSTYSVGCAFDVSSLGAACTNASDFGYTTGKPCIFLRLNKIIAWDPKPLLDGTNSSKEFEFSQIPSHLKTQYVPNANNSFIPISCEPENDADYDNIRSITFYPSTGIPSYFFPYWNQPNYQPPAVMAQVDLVPGVTVMLWCKFWTQNVQHDYGDLQGSIHVELFLMNDPAKHNIM